MAPCASTGEKMTETEIDALMAGQEDENGSVHYEGKSSLPSKATSCWLQLCTVHFVQVTKKR